MSYVRNGVVERVYIPIESGWGALEIMGNVQRSNI
jgi:hypothetical protein